MDLSSVLRSPIAHAAGFFFSYILFLLAAYSFQSACRSVCNTDEKNDELLPLADHFSQYLHY